MKLEVPTSPAAPTYRIEKHRRVTGQEREQVTRDLVKRYIDGESLRQIAASTGRSEGWVRNVLTEGGVTIRGSWKPRAPTGQARDRVRKDAVKLYNSGKTIEQVGVLLRLSPYIVRRLLGEAGVAVRKGRGRGNPPIHVPEQICEKVARRFRAGATMHELRRIVGHSNEVVWRVLASQGISRRHHLKGEERSALVKTLVKRYERETTRELARSTGLSQSTIANMLREGGARLRPRGPRRKDRLWP